MDEWVRSSGDSPAYGGDRDVNDEGKMHLRARACWQGVEEEDDRARLA